MFSAFSKLKVEIFGASHAEEIGIRIKGIPCGQAVDADKVQAFVDERKSGENVWSTPRREPDKVIFESGLRDGKITQDMICAVIKNTTQRSADYGKMKSTPRPSHADYVAIIKDGANVNLAGGGRFSGRMTAPMCIAGGIALQILSKYGIEIGAYVCEIGGVKGKTFDYNEITFDEIKSAKEKGFFALEKNKEMKEKIISVTANGDSVGGKIECIVYGLPVGLGNALYEGIEGRMSASIFAVPAVKSVEFGLGTGVAEIRGSEMNDAFCIRNGKMQTVTNNNGGINGGISNGMPITVRVGIKPTPSISLPQKTVDLTTMTETEIRINGRHDACIVPRAVPAIKSAVALTVLDLMIEEKIITECK